MLTARPTSPPTAWKLSFELPLGEVVFDFYDKLKSISRGYASFDYHPIGFKESDLIKLDILLNGEKVDALSALIHRDHAHDLGKRMCSKLKELLPGRCSTSPSRRAIGAKIVARETVKALRKDVTAKCYGGDISRKRKAPGKAEGREEADEARRQCRDSAVGFPVGAEERSGLRLHGRTVGALHPLCAVVRRRDHQLMPGRRVHHIDRLAVHELDGQIVAGL
jgi:hypothetical protein